MALLFREKIVPLQYFLNAQRNLCSIITSSVASTLQYMTQDQVKSSYYTKIQSDTNGSNS